MTTFATPCAVSPAPTRRKVIGPPTTVAPTDQLDSLSEVDDVLGDWSNRRQAFVQRQAEARAARQQFESDALDLARTVIRPAFDALAARLNADGGGGRVYQRLADSSHCFRLRLWMSLEGEIATPRQDRNPYLQLDLDVRNSRINVWEGDMWKKQGSSRDSTPWRLDEITNDAVTQRVIAILHRAASHDVVA
jgi:hypothetical protein